MKRELIEKISKKTMKVGIVGLGYVGLPLAVEYAKSGFVTTGFDVSNEKVEKINNGENYIGDIADEELEICIKKGVLCATSDFRRVSDMDFIAICVPSPLDEHGQPDMSYIESSAKYIADNLTDKTVVVLESTTYPGTTEELVKPILEEGSGLECEKDFYLGFSPERVDPGNAVYKTGNTPKVVGGIGEEAADVIAEMYRAALNSKIYKVSSPAVAEMEKILENTYRNINIGLVNEMAILCHKMGIDIWEVIEAASTKPYGFQPFFPGPGLGGHCIPLDPSYLSWRAKEYSFHTSMIESSMVINDKMPEYCVDRAAKILNDYEKPLKKSKILVLGVAYKQDINDYRESAAIKVIEIFKENGSLVDFYDPFVPSYTHKGQKYEGLETITGSLIEEYDLVVITTAHSAFDYAEIQKSAKHIFDTRNAMKNITERSNISVL